MTITNELPLAWDRRARLIAGALGLATFLTQFDVTALVVVVPAIGRDLGVGMPRLAWAIDAYSLAFASTLLAAGALADRYGRRRALLVGNGVFLVASLACGVAPTAVTLWIARGGQGIGAAFAVTGALASIASAFPEPGARARAFGLVGVLSGVAMALGPSFGGLIAAWFGWRAIFFANVAPCLLIAIAVPRLVRETHHASMASIDWPGIVLLTCALGLFIEGLLQAREEPVRCAATMAVGVAMVAVFATRQRRQPSALLDPAVFASRPMIGVAILLMAVSVGYWAVLVYLPAFLTTTFGLSPDRAGLTLLAATLPMLVIPPLGGRLAHRFGLRRLFGAALATLAVGDTLLVATTGERALALTGAFVGMATIGVGAALAHPQLSGAVVAFAPPQAAGMASAVTVVARQGGFALGVAALAVAAPTDPAGTSFTAVFVLATFAAVVGLGACLLLPSSGERAGGRDGASR